MVSNFSLLGKRRLSDNVVIGGVPAKIIERLNAETIRIAHDPVYLEQLKMLGSDAATSTPEAFGAFVRQEIATWTDIVKRSGARAE